MKYYETIKGKDFSDLRHYDIYIKDLNAYIRFYSDMLYIQDLNGAMQPGKTCTNYRIYFNDCELLNFVNGDWNGFVKSVLNGAEIHFKHYVDNKKGTRVFSPWAKLNPVKKVPKKWTLKHVRNLYANGQIVKAECRGYYTDDYAYDAAVNFGKGETNTAKLVKDVVESPGGWWIREEKTDNDIIKISLCGHTFNTNTLYITI